MLTTQHVQTPFHHRDPGLLGLLGADNCPFFSIIVDGIHAHRHSTSLVYRAQPSKVVLITDAMSAMGLPPGAFALGHKGSIPAGVVVCICSRAFMQGTSSSGTWRLTYARTGTTKACTLFCLAPRPWQGLSPRSSVVCGSTWSSLDAPWPKPLKLHLSIQHRRLVSTTSVGHLSLADLLISCCWMST